MGNMIGAAEVAKKLGISVVTLSHWIKNKRFLAPKLGGGHGYHRKWLEEDVDNYIREL